MDEALASISSNEKAEKETSSPFPYVFIEDMFITYHHWRILNAVFWIIFLFHINTMVFS
jgi:hypothetical protein